MSAVTSAIAFSTGKSVAASNTTRSFRYPAAASAAFTLVMSRGVVSASMPTVLDIGVSGQKKPTPVRNIDGSVPTTVVTTSSWLTAPINARRMAGLLNGGCRWFMRRMLI